MHTQRRLLFLIFAFSGFSGLIYESIWTHYLKLFLGHAAYAQTLVLAIFMGGMALGSWWCGMQNDQVSGQQLWAYYAPGLYQSYSPVLAARLLAAHAYTGASIPYLP